MNFEVPRPVSNLGFPKLFLPQEAILDPPFDIEVIYIALMLYLSK